VEKTCPACLKPNPEKTGFIECLGCRTLYFNGERDYTYDLSYFEARAHHEPGVASAKIRTFTSFWKRLLPVQGKALEVGCGIGLGLKAALGLGIDAYGFDIATSILEKVTADIRPRIAIGDLNKLSAHKFDAVAFFDSFEHIPDPDRFLAEMGKLVVPGTRLIFTLPRADSLSRHMMGKYWPYFSPDHFVHYSLKGMKEILSRSGYRITGRFFPAKLLHSAVISKNLSIRSGREIKIPLPDFSLWMNIGQMGLIAERQ
jgi:SAM-dependent methyltransferase